MATTPNSVISAQVPNRGIVKVTNANGTTPETVYTSGANGSKVVALILTSTDGALAHAVNIYITNGAVNYLLGTVNVPINSGAITSAPTVNALALGVIPGLPLDSDGNPYIHLVSGDTLQIQMAVAITSGDFVYGYAVAGDF